MRWIAGLVGLALVPIAAGAGAALELYGTTAADPATPVLLDPANPGQAASGLLARNCRKRRRPWIATSKRVMLDSSLSQARRPRIITLPPSG